MSYLLWMKQQKGKITCPLNEENMALLTVECNPLAESQSFGVDIYTQVVEFASTKLERGNGFLE